MPLSVSLESCKVMVHLLRYFCIKTKVGLTEIMENIVSVSDITWPPAGYESMLVEEELACDEGVCWSRKVRIG